MRIRGIGAGAVALAMLVLAPGALAGPIEDSQELRNEVTLGGMIEHEQKLQAIASAHQGNRAAGTIGYEQSAAYVARRLEAAGYRVHMSPFDFPTWEENSTPQLEQLSPTPTDYVAGENPEDDDNPAVDFITFEFSASGEVTAPVVPTNDIVIPPVGAADGNTSGCEPEDFPAETAGAISLIQRGTCPFVQKLAFAAEAGAVGVILFNEGNPGRTNVIARIAEPYYPVPAVGASFALGEELYNSFQAGDNPTVRMKVDATTNPRRQDNVIAESQWGAGPAVVVGGHLDSVPAGPGINDNGSGVSAILETAEEMAELHDRSADAIAAAEAKVADSRANVDERRARVDELEAKVDRREAKKNKAKRKLEKAEGKKQKRKAKKKLKRKRKKFRQAKADLATAEQELATAEQELATAEQELAAAQQRFRPRQPLRIAFWGAEEAGLIGSSQYVEQLSQAEQDQILLNLNFDMLGSPNFVRFVYDGNTDETDPPPGGAPPGSDQIEQVFLDYFASQGLPTEPTAFDGRSDYGPFIAEGIPAGGLFSGAEDPKTAEQVPVYGGVADEQYDPCYHEVCDTFDSVFGAGPPGLPMLAGNGATSLDQMADAVAHSTFHYVTAENPLGRAATSKRPSGDQPYRLPYRGDRSAER